MQHVAQFADLAQDRPTEVKLGEDTLILVRDGDTARAFEGKCPHAGAPLAKGAVCDGRIICPWHKASFAVAGGALLEPPALQGLAEYRTETRDGAVFVDPARIVPARPHPAPDDRHVVLLGAGAAAAACAASLREFGFAGAISMVGAEPDPPYDRTALSKFVLEGGKAPDEIAELLPEGFYEEKRITRVEGEVAGLDAARRQVRLADGRTLDYSAALVATGAAPKPLDVPGAVCAGVFTLRSKADAAQIVARAEQGGRAVILGGSFIGLEAASALRKRGLAVDVVSPEAIPFEKQFGPEIGTMFRTLHEANGVRFHAGTKAARIEGSGAVSGVALENGETLPADLVLVGTGVAPVTGFVQGIAREEDGGIRVDRGMQAAPGLYAAGDVACFPFGDGSNRIEHWRVAQQQGRIAARNIAGGQAGFDGVPFFWTYHFGKRFEYLGHAEGWDETVVEGDLDTQDFVALLVKSGQVAAVVACQRERATCVLIERMRGGLTKAAALAVVRGA